MKFTELEIERQRHANEIHELNRELDDLRQAVEFLDAKLRDQFAMAAMQGLAHQVMYLVNPIGLAELSYKLADAMIDEREKALMVKRS